MDGLMDWSNKCMNEYMNGPNPFAGDSPPAMIQGQMLEWYHRTSQVDSQVDSQVVKHM